MKERLNLTTGEIAPTLIKLARPIMATSFVQMLYNLTDQMWLGRYNTDALAGAGISGYIMWVGMATALVASVGSSVNMAQAIGEKNFEKANDFISDGMKWTLILSVIFSSAVFFNAAELISFFNLRAEAFEHGFSYLRIVSAGFPLHFYNVVFAALYNASGKSKTPFFITALGLALNIILDPVLIFAANLGAKGAAIATVVSQTLVFFIFIFSLSREEPWMRGEIFSKPGAGFWKIIKVGVPAGMQAAFFAGVSIYLLRLISKWGPEPIAVQSVGAQIESISWMTSEGFSTAITAFVAQNYGAKNIDRVKKGFHIGLKILIIFGLVTTSLFIFFGGQIISIFTPRDPVAIEYGTTYLFIFGISQVFMMFEGASLGTFNGMGRTEFPAINGIIFNGIRIPFSYLLLNLGTDFKGVWWAMSLSTVLKGGVLFISAVLYLNKLDK